MPIPVNLVPKSNCKTFHNSARCDAEYFGWTSQAAECDLGAPLLCVENGSISFRAILSHEEDGKLKSFNFVKGIYHLLAALTTKYRKKIHEYTLLMNLNEIK